jgi:dipeptidyl-peptidase-4
MVLIPVHGHLWLYRNDELTELYNASARGPAIDPQMSPDGTALACVLSKEICCMQLTDFSHVVQLTSGADGEGILNGVADFLSQEEMNRYTGFWWAPDSQSILFTSVDQTAVPEYYITNLGTDVVETESHRYPFAGEANPAVKLGVVKVSKPLEIVWLRLPEGDQDVYIARAGWFPDGFVMAQVSVEERRVMLFG